MTARARWAPRLGLVLTCIAGFLSTASAATAIPTVRLSRMPGGPNFSTGVVDDQLFENPSLAVERFWFSKAIAIGPKANSHSHSWVRLPCYWIIVAPANRAPGFHPTNPADPQYNWSGCDAEIESAAAAHERILVNVSYAPVWAEGPNAPSGLRPGVWSPNPQEFGQFARAVAERYSGHFRNPLDPRQYLPRVTYFQAWNEPNLAVSLAPQWRRTRSGAYEPLSPTLYRQLLNAFYSNVTAVQPHATVLAAGTAPYGDPAREHARMEPLLFWEQLLCVHGRRLTPSSCPVRAHLDAIDNHPYTVVPTLHAFDPLNVSVPDIYKLDGVLTAAERSHRVLPSGPKAVWETEIGWNTNPPMPGAISPAQQARYLALTWYEEWQQRITVAMWFTLRDPGFALGNLTGVGLYFGNGAAKPAAQAYEFPFVALPQPHHSMIIWGRAPAPGTVTIELGAGRGWRALFRVRTTSGGVFYVQRRIAAHSILRAVEPGATSLAWHSGPAPR